jgi:hypothetical protein
VKNSAEVSLKLASIFSAIYFMLALLFIAQTDVEIECCGDWYWQLIVPNDKGKNDYRTERGLTGLDFGHLGWSTLKFINLML